MWIIEATVAKQDVVDLLVSGIDLLLFGFD
jgi:hypothetical protein